MEGAPAGGGGRGEVVALQEHLGVGCKENAVGRKRWISSFSLLRTPYSLLSEFCSTMGDHRLRVVNQPLLCYIHLPHIIHLSVMSIPIVAVWKKEWNDPSFRRQTLITMPVLLAVLFTLARFLEFAEQRAGATLPDPVLVLFTPIDVTWLTFGLIYVGLVVGIGYLLRRPRYLLLAIQSYVVMVLFRIVAMYLLPLDPPASLIPLADPLVEYFGTGKVLTKDLFFSGHTATLFILFLAAPGRWVKAVFLTCTISVAVCVLVQHVHYSIDVFAGPVFAFTAYQLVMRFRRDLPASSPK